MKEKKITLRRNFLGVDLSDVNINKLPVPLICITGDIIKTKNDNDADMGHFYHSDQPSYDHTRDD